MRKPALFLIFCILLIVSITIMAGCIGRMPAVQPKEPKTLSAEVHLVPQDVKEYSRNVTVTYTLVVNVTNEGDVEADSVNGWVYIFRPDGSMALGPTDTLFSIKKIAPGATGTVTQTIRVSLTKEQYARVLNGAKMNMSVYIPGYA